MRFLITTADERSWRSDREVVFLGEWCVPFDRAHLWAGSDAVMASAFCPTGPERDAALAEVDRISSQLLAELGSVLNAQHGLDADARFWRILLGHWINRHTSVLFQRWHVVRLMLAEHQIAGTIVFTNPGLSLAVNDTDSFTWACNDSVWNNLLIGDLLQRLSKAPIEYLPIADAETPSRVEPRPYGLLAWAARLLQKDTDSLIINSYLPRGIAFQLHLGLHEVPQQRRSPDAPRMPADAALRACLRHAQGATHSAANPPDEFAAYARDMLFQMLPTCFLEGFSALQREVGGLDWPECPRFVLTSGSFDADEVFKLWAARRVTEGRPYYIGQHGNNFGTSRYRLSESECVATGDAFLTWGWRENEKCVPTFIFKTAGRHQRHDPRGGLLLVEASLLPRFLSWDPYPEFKIYQEDQFVFVRDLPDAVRAGLVVRLHAGHRRERWCEVQRWRQREPQITLDPGTRPIAALLAGSRLVVHSYDSTGILETLSLDVPTVCFWSGGLEHLRDSAVPFYRTLVDAGILHLTASGAARHVAQIWNDVDAWWRSAPVQAARLQFCERYARRSTAPVRELVSLLGGAKGSSN